MSPARPSRGFTLIELLITIALIAMLGGLLVPGLVHTRHSARAVQCAAQLRGLTQGWHLYANDFAERAMPLAYTRPEDVGPGGMARYWWGSHGTSSTPPDYSQGFLSPYLSTSLSAGSALECPAQPLDSYLPQGPGARWPTSTYGYNGYFLSPSRTPGYDATIGRRPWQRVGDLRNPTRTFVFADSMIRQGNILRNCALLDPPLLYIGSTQGNGSGTWAWNSAPTTAFRHGLRRIDARGVAALVSVTGLAQTARADGSVRGIRSEPAWLMAGTFLGSVGTTPGQAGEAADASINEAHYVPDASAW